MYHVFYHFTTSKSYTLPNSDKKELKRSRIWDPNGVYVYEYAQCLFVFCCCCFFFVEGGGGGGAFIFFTIMSVCIVLETACDQLDVRSGKKIWALQFCFSSEYKY